MMRTATLLCASLTVGLLGLAAYRYTVEKEAADHAAEAPVPPEEALTIEDADRDLGRQRPNAPIPVRFILKNASQVPIRVLGLAPC